MKRSQRSLLVMFNQDLKSQNAIEQEVGLLHEILYTVEDLDNVIVSHEVLDLNRHKIVTHPDRLRRAFRETPKGFVFINNLN